MDPGFEGKLLIPLHNLTSSAYSVDTNEALIWIEFTKTTYGIKPGEGIACADRSLHFRSFPDSKKNLTPDQYLRKANAGNPIASSIPASIETSERLAKAAERTTTRISRLVTGIGVVALVTLIVTLAGLYFQVASLIQSSIALTTSVDQSLAEISANAKIMADKLEAARTQADQQTLRIDQISSEMGTKAITGNLSASQTQFDQLRQRLDQINRDLEALKARSSGAQRKP